MEEEKERLVLFCEKHKVEEEVSKERIWQYLLYETFAKIVGITPVYICNL